MDGSPGGVRYKPPTVLMIIMPSETDVALKSKSGRLGMGWKSLGRTMLRAPSVLIIGVLWVIW